MDVGRILLVEDVLDPQQERIVYVVGLTPVVCLAVSCCSHDGLDAYD